MRWTPGGPSSDIEDQRGGGGGFNIGGRGGLGCGGVIILLVLSLLFHRNFFALFDNSGGGQRPAAVPGEQAPPASETPDEKKSVQFVSFVLDDAQSTWDRILPEQTGKRYRHAKLVLFRDAIQSACGSARSSSGPFYCPEDQRVYIDLGFYDELKQRFGAPGDFAQAYVIAHELGHHVQRILGTEAEVHRAMENDPDRANAYSVRLELQADCYAGVWGHSTSERGILENGDVEEGLNAAASIGDDRLQRMSGRSVNPDSFTHGSSQQRVTWFKRGFESGRIADCDTFAK